MKKEVVKSFQYQGFIVMVTMVLQDERYALECVDVYKGGELVNHEFTGSNPETDEIYSKAEMVLEKLNGRISGDVQPLRFA